MASFLVQGVKNGLADFRSGQWSYGDLANGFRSGHGNITSCQTIYQLNQYNPEQSRGNQVRSLFHSTWKIFKTTLKAHRLAPITPLLANHKTALKTVACSWVGMNVLAWLWGTAKPSKHSIRNITVWKATPFLLFILNVALTSLELRTNPRKVLISYAVLALDIADTFEYLPEQVSYLMNRILPLPMRALSIYYSDSNWKRAVLVIEGFYSDEIVNFCR